MVRSGLTLTPTPTQKWDLSYTLRNLVQNETPKSEVPIRNKAYRLYTIKQIVFCPSKDYLKLKPEEINSTHSLFVTIM